jgi:hypothetical protein
VSRTPASILAVALLLGLGSARLAGQDMSAEEFAAKAGALGDAVNASGNDSAECLELKRRADELVGRPQLRHTAMEEYRAVCQGGGGPVLPTDNSAQFDSPPRN